MPEIDVGVDVEGAIESRLERDGYQDSLIADILDDIIDDFYILLAQDLVAGESDWPVDTGYSEASFYADGDTLQNFASYSIYVEGYTGAVQDYVTSNMDDLIDRALDLAVIPRPEATRQPGLFDRRPLNLRNLLTGAAAARAPGALSLPLIFRTQRVNPFLRGISRGRGNRR